MKLPMKSDLKKVVPLRKLYFDYIKDINAALLFGQLVYWSKKTKDPNGWIYKSQDELFEEVFLTAYQQRRARKILVEKKLIEEEIKGAPKRMYFRVLYDPMDYLDEALDGQLNNKSEVDSKGTLLLETNKLNNVNEETSLLEIDKLNNVDKETKQYSIIGENTTKNTTEITTYHCNVNENKNNFSNSIQEVFEHWKLTMNKPNAKLDRDRRKLIREALKSGYTVEQLCQAISGCAVTPHNIGQNERGQRYDGLHIILKNADQIDRFIMNYQSPPKILTKLDTKIGARLAAADEWFKGL